jgi:pilus assembly protein Flp/PilA
MVFFKFPRREEGQGLVEYALILVLVAVVVIAVLLVLGPAVRDVFNKIVFRLYVGNGSDFTISFNGAPEGAKNPAGSSTCNYTVSVPVKALKGSIPVDGLPLTGVVYVTNSAGYHLTTINISGTTDGSGQANLVGSVSGASCNGAGGTINVTGGGSITVSGL